MIWVLLTLTLLPVSRSSIQSNCDIQPAEIGEDTTLEVRFCEDLRESSLVDFSIEHRRYNSREVFQMMRCRFLNGDVQCNNNTCCTPDKSVIDTFRMVIHNVSQQHVGQYWGLISPVDLAIQKSCNFILRASICSINDISVRNSHINCSAYPVTVGHACNVTCYSVYSDQRRLLSMTYTCVGKEKWSPLINPYQCDEQLKDLEMVNSYFLFLLLSVIPIVIFMVIVFKKRYQEKKKKEKVKRELQAVRSPLVVVREMMDSEDKQVHEDTVSDVTVPTDGPPVMRIEHRDGQSDHTGVWPHDCVECGHQVARVLTELDVGRTGDSNGSPPLQYRDVLVMFYDYPTDDRVNSFGLKTTTTSGLVRGLRDRHVPVRVVKEGDKAAIRDTVLGVGDLVTVANWRDVQDLERKVVVVEKRFDLFERLLAMSRCTTQLVLIDYLFVPFSTVRITIKLNCQSPCYSQIMTIANTTGIVLTAN